MLLRKILLFLVLFSANKRSRIQNPTIQKMQVIPHVLWKLKCFYHTQIQRKPTHANIWLNMSNWSKEINLKNVISFLTIFTACFASFSVFLYPSPSLLCMNILAEASAPSSSYCIMKFWSGIFQMKNLTI